MTLAELLVMRLARKRPDGPVFLVEDAKLVPYIEARCDVAAIHLRSLNQEQALAFRGLPVVLMWGGLTSGPNIAAILRSAKPSALHAFDTHNDEDPRHFAERVIRHLDCVAYDLPKRQEVYASN